MVKEVSQRAHLDITASLVRSSLCSMGALSGECGILHVLAFLSVIHISHSTTLIGPADSCSLEEFTASCKDNEIIMIESAVYGRMAHGKCFPQSEGNFGCYSDVRHILDSLCSGTQTCSVPVLHRAIVATKPCGSMMGYMTVSHKCLKVSNPNHLCASGKLTITEQNGFLSPSNECQVLLNVPSGHLINITVYNFMKSQMTSACYEIATIQSQKKVTSVHLCPTDPRIKEVMVTDGSSVTIEMTNVDMGQIPGGYLLHFEATGCPQPTIPPNAQLERNGDTAKIICNGSDNSWFVYCKNNKWTGQERKCPQKVWTISKIFETNSTNFPYGVFLTSFVGVGIGIFLGGFLLFLAINAFQRHQRRLRQMYEAPPVIPDPDYKIYDTSKMDFNLVPGFATGRHTIPRHQMSPPPIPLQPPEDERRFSRHTYEKPKYNSTDNFEQE